MQGVYRQNPVEATLEILEDRGGVLLKILAYRLGLSQRETREIVELLRDEGAVEIEEAEAPEENRVLLKKKTAG